MSAFHFALPCLRDRGHDALGARGFHRQADEQRVADAGAVADFMEVGLLDRAAVRGSLGFGQDGVDGAHMVAHRRRNRQAVDGGKNLPDIVMMAIGDACGIGRRLKTLARIGRQLQQGIAQKLVARGVLGKVPSKGFPCPGSPSPCWLPARSIIWA